MLSAPSAASISGVIGYCGNWLRGCTAMTGKRTNAPAATHKESYYQTRIIRWLKDQYPGAFIWKAAAGPYSQGGIPDICAIIDGHFFGFEVKRPEAGRLSKLQEQAIRKINAAGGTAAVVSYPAQAQEVIDRWKENADEK